MIEIQTTAFWRIIMQHVQVGLLLYFLTSLVAVLGVTFGHEFGAPSLGARTKPPDVGNAFATWNGRWYYEILKDGYRYDPKQASTVALFPALPVLGRAVAGATGLRGDLALLVVVHLSLAGAFVIFAAYANLRLADAATLTPWVLLAFGLFPTTFTFRTAQSEALLLFCSLLALYGMERRWRPVIVAAIVGLATATRPPAAALVPVFLVYLWNESRAENSRRLLRFLVRALLLAPVATWGLLAYAVYLSVTFDAPLAFAQAQENLRVRPAIPWHERAWALATLEPFRCVYDPECACYWRRFEAHDNPLFSMSFLNPIFFLGTALVLAWGVWRRQLTTYECLLSAGLLLIGYVTRGHEVCTGGLGRFAAVAWPVYLLMGLGLQRLPPPLAAAIVAISGFLMGTYAALYAAWYRFF